MAPGATPRSANGTNWHHRLNLAGRTSLGSTSAAPLYLCRGLGWTPSRFLDVSWMPNGLFWGDQAVMSGDGVETKHRCGNDEGDAPHAGEHYYKSLPHGCQADSPCILCWRNDQIVGGRSGQAVWLRSPRVVLRVALGCFCAIRLKAVNPRAGSDSLPRGIVPSTA